MKIEWSATKEHGVPDFVMVPGTLKSVSFIEKDTKTQVRVCNTVHICHQLSVFLKRG